VGAAARRELFLVSVIEEGVQVGVGDEVNGPARAPIAAVRAAARHELLAPKTHGAPAAMSRRDVDVNFVDEQSRILPAFAFGFGEAGW
jgi:hypothetical protein